MSYRVILESESPIRLVGDVPPPPLPPPPPPPPPPPEDTSPFVFPPQPPFVEGNDPSWRGAGLGDGCYAVAPQYGPPHQFVAFAGFIQAGQAGAWNLAGYKLWVPWDTPPAVIRRMLAVGR